MKFMKLDIVYISYNQAPYVKDALDGILMQQLPSSVETRIIIADDCSIDGTIDIIKKYEQKSPFPFVYLTAKHNIGMLENYRRVFQSIKGDFVAILEGDDYWTDPMKLQKQIHYLSEHPKCGMCYTDCSINGGRKGFTKSVLDLKPNRRFDTENPIFIDVYFANLTWMFRKEMIKYFILPDYCTDIPLLMFYEMCLHTQIGCIDDNTGVFRVHSGSVSNTSGDKKYWFRKGFFLLSEHYARLFPNVERNLAHVYTVAIYDGVYYQAKQYNDSEIVSMFEEFFGNRLDFDAIKNIIDIDRNENEWIQCELTKQINQARSSLRYKIGSFILHPIDFFQKKKRM